LEEWNEVRKAAFDELRKYPIPESLIQAVQDFRPHAEVSWVTEQGKPANINDPAEPVVASPKKESKEMESTQQITSHLAESCFESESELFPRTAGDALAACLRPHLARLRRAKNAPVRAGKMLPRSTIATIAMDIFETNRLFGKVQGEELGQLLRELLDLDRPKVGADRQFVARHNAAWILAQDERVPTRELERALGVNASSISRWRKEPAFRQMIQNNRKAISDLKSRGLWPPKLKDGERLELTAQRTKLSQLHDAMADFSSFLTKIFAHAKKPKDRRGKEAWELVCKLKRKFPELETFCPNALRTIEAEIKEIDYELASDSEKPNLSVTSAKK
jgi:hypothetical protein